MTREQLKVLQAWVEAVARFDTNLTAVTLRERDAAFEAVLAALNPPASPAPDRYAAPGPKEAQHAALYALLNKGVPASPIGCSKLATHLMDIWPQLKAIMEPDPSRLAICKSCTQTILLDEPHICPGIRYTKPCV
jgi:hypothetical protein